jgi:hypothetical protein
VPRTWAANDVNYNDTPSPLVGLLQRHPELFTQKVLQHLDPLARTFLAQTGRACRDALYSSGLPRAGTTQEVLVSECGGKVLVGKTVWVVTHKLEEFLGSAERLAWV